MITLESELSSHHTINHYSPPGVHYYIEPHDPLENEQAPPPIKIASTSDTTLQNPKPTYRPLAVITVDVPIVEETFGGINRLDEILRKAEQGKQLTAQEILEARALFAFDAKQVRQLREQVGIDPMLRGTFAGILVFPDEEGGDAGSLDALQFALDVYGTIPIIGEPLDLLNATISVARGNYMAAALSAVSVVPVVGDAVGKGGKLILRYGDEAADAAFDAAKRMPEAPKRDVQGRFTSEAGGHSATAARGQEALRNYRHALGEGYQFEYTLPSGRRVDAVDIENRIVRELKPDNPRAIQDGRRQVERYRQELESIFGGNWTAVIDTYTP